jgi:hypothetical protein
LDVALPKKIACAESEFDFSLSSVGFCERSVLHIPTIKNSKRKGLNFIRFCLNSKNTIKRVLMENG